MSRRRFERRPAGPALPGAVAAVLLALASAVLAPAQEGPGEAPAASAAPAPDPSAVRFTSVNAYVDTKDAALGAYQFEFAAETGRVTVVGIEGGDVPAFKAPPYYDPRAMSLNRVILAAYSTDADLPRGKTRVARIHLQITGGAARQFVAKLQTAAGPDGKPVAAVVSLSESHAGPDLDSRSKGAEQ